MKRAFVFLAAIAAAAATASAAERPLYDPAADPAFDLARARTVAIRTHRNLLLEIGGNWCVWCLVLNRALHTDSNLKRLLDAGYVPVRVNVSPDNPNMSFMARFPAATGYPFLIVLSPDGSKNPPRPERARLPEGQDAAGRLRSRLDRAIPRALARLSDGGSRSAASRSIGAG